MGASLIFYTSSALTTQQFVLPVGTAETPLTLSSFSSFTEDDKTYYYFTGGWNPLTASSVTPYDMTGKDYTPAITDGLSTAYIKYNSGYDNAVWDTWYYGAHVVRNSGGTAQNDPRIAAAEVLVEGVPFIALGGIDIYGVLSPSLMVSKNMLGSKAFTQQGGPDTPPGAGADAGAGWGAYDFTSQEAQGSTLPTSPSLPVSPDGHGLHAYTMSPEAYQVLGNALWGIGDAGNNIAFADMWQKWKNFKFNPTAGIISCIRLPSVFTPSRTGLSDTNIKLSGTWAVAGGQFSSITGCKPADVSPISCDALSVDIPEQYGSWLDYEGGIEITLDLPFCGRMQIDPSACVSGGIDVQYRCDPCNGNVSAFVFTRDRWGASQLYNVAHGNCALQVPLTGHDDGQVQMLGSFVGSAASLAGAAVSPAMAAGAAAGTVSSMLMRREVTQVVGSAAGSVSYVGNVTPVIIISYAHPVKSPGTVYDDLEGRPCGYGLTVGDYSGYNRFDNVHADIPAASAEECLEIERLLAEGVYV